jgi:cytochrome c biogenesis protein CcdA
MTAFGVACLAGLAVPVLALALAVRRAADRIGYRRFVRAAGGRPPLADWTGKFARLRRAMEVRR